jgi:putative ubiquitin-RnfH superfamily antitoxin RatB of RatAB toxin-antitoxin module
MARATEIAVEIVYALPGEQVLLRLSLAAGATVGEAIRQSGLLQRYPQLHAAALCAGVFGNRVAMDARLNDGDRVEIYRPLTVDPKEARRRRVALRTARKTAV